MDGLAKIITTLGSDERLWVVLALFAGLMLYSLVRYMVCPMMKGKLEISPEEAQRAMNAPYRHSWRFLALMVLGIGLAIFGLLKLAHGAQAPMVAVTALVLGVYLFTTEPQRFAIRAAQERVVAFAGGPQEVEMVENLRQTHQGLMFREAAILGMLVLAVVAI